MIILRGNEASSVQRNRKKKEGKKNGKGFRIQILFDNVRDWTRFEE